MRPLHFISIKLYSLSELSIGNLFYLATTLPSIQPMYEYKID